MSKKGIDRSTFLKTAGSAALFAALGITFTGCGGSDSVTGSDTNDNGNNNNGNGGSGISISGNVVTLDLQASNLSGLRVSGGWLLIAEALVLVVNIDGDFIRAFSSVCPHEGCTTDWSFANNRFRCNCHNSVFENDGTFVAGPAGQDLQEFQVERDGDIVTITKS